MRGIVLDFDGVIADSARECFAVALRTYLELCPASALGAQASADLYPRFLELIPLGNRAEDYGTALAALESGASLPDQPAYDAYRRSRDPGWIERFHARYYEVRHELAAADPAGWRALMPPYPGVLDLLRRRSGDHALAIATSKDRVSVLALLAAYGIADLFIGERIVDKQAGPDKAVHLELLRRRLGFDFDDLTFVDDKVNHLDSVAPLGVRCALAAWGYNGPREHALARSRGYRVCTLDDVEAQVFESPASTGR